MKTIWFDMDGTIANLYGVDNWLDKLIAEDATPYAEAKPLLNMSQLAKELNRLTRQGYAVNIISWLSKGASQAYNEKVSKAKRAWLKKHLKSVQFALSFAQKSVILRGSKGACPCFGACESRIRNNIILSL